MKQLADRVASDSALRANLQSDPEGTLRALELPDTGIYRMVVLGLELGVVLIIVAAGVLAFYGKSMPGELYVLAGTMAGAVASVINRAAQ